MAEPADESQALRAASLARAYEMYMVPALFDPWAAILLEAVEVRPSDRVMDVACGSGVVARRAAMLAGEHGHVTACDISAPMLAQARASVGQHSAAITFLECPADVLGVADESQDVVTCQMGLQFFPNRLAALREMYRVLRPGGRVGLVVWAAEHPLGFFSPISAALALVAEEPHPGAFDLSSYAIDAENVESLLRSSGFGHVRVETRSRPARWKSLDDALAAIGGTALGMTIRVLPAEPRARALAQLARSFTAEADGSVTCMTFAHVVTGSRPSLEPNREQ